MAEINVNPTRMELKKLKNRLATARRGHKLLKDKRDELMRQFIELVKKNKELREAVEAKLANVHRSFTAAAAVSSPRMLEEALMLPKKEAALVVSTRSIMNVKVPVFDIDIPDGGSSDGQNYGFAFTSGELDEAVLSLSELLPELLKLAETEKTVQLLADEIEKTRRRVNALEYTMIPALEEAIKRISMKLAENERGNTTRLMKVKDMMLQRAIEMRRGAESEA